MMDDPLLNSQASPGQGTPKAVRNGAKPAGATPRGTRRPPARSAKILAAGLSTTAMLGMTTGYAFAGVVQEKNQSTTVPPAPAAPAAPETAADATAGTTTRQTIAPAAPSPATDTVIDVPVPGAQPGSGSSNWNSQPSSGSN